MKWRQQLPAILLVLTLQVFLVGSQGQFNLHMLRRHLNARRPFPQHVPNARFQNFNPQLIAPRFPAPNLLPRGTPQLQPGSVQPTFPGSNAAALPQINRSWQPVQQQNVQSAQIPQTNQNLQNSQPNPLPNTMPNPNLVQKQIHEFQRLQMMLRHIKQQKQRQLQQQQQQQQRRQQLIQQIQAIQRARTLQGANARVAGTAHVAKINQMEKMIRDMIKYRDQLKREAAFRQKTRQVTISNNSNREQISTADVQSGPSILIMDKNTVTEIPIVTTKKPNGSLGQNMIVFAKTANIHSNVDLQHNKGVELKHNQQSPPRQPQQQRNDVTTPQPVAFQNNVQHNDNHFKGHHSSNAHNADPRIQQQQHHLEQQHHHEQHQQQHQEVPQKIASDVLGNIFETHQQGNTQSANLHSKREQKPQRQTQHELMTKKQHFTNTNAGNTMQNVNIPKTKSNQQFHNNHQNLKPMWDQNHSPNTHVSSNHHNNGPAQVNGHQARKTSQGNIEKNAQHLMQTQHIPQRPNVQRNNPTQLDLPPLGMIPDQFLQSQNNYHRPTTSPPIAMNTVGNQQPGMQSSSNNQRNSLRRKNLSQENRINIPNQQMTNQITTPINRVNNPNPYDQNSNIRFPVTTVIPQTWEQQAQRGQQSRHFQPPMTTASNIQIHGSSKNHPQRINRQLFKRPPRPSSTPSTVLENRHESFIRQGQQSKFGPRVDQQIMQTPSPIVGDPSRQFIPTTPTSTQTTPRPSFNDYFNQIPKSSPRKVRINFRKPAAQQTNLSIMTPPPVIPTQPNYPPPPTQVPSQKYLQKHLPTLPPPHPNLEQVPRFQMNQVQQRSPRQNLTPPPVVPIQPNYPLRTTEGPSPQYPQHPPTIPPPLPNLGRNFQTKQINQQSIQQLNTIAPNIRFFTTTESPSIHHPERKHQRVNHGQIPFSGVSNNKHINQNQIANVNNYQLPQTIPAELQHNEIQKWKSEMRISNSNSNHQSGSSNTNFRTKVPLTTTEKPRIVTPKQRKENPLAKLLRLLQRKAPSIKFASERHNQQRPPQVKKSHSRRTQRRPIRPSIARPTQVPFTGLPLRPKPNSFPFNSHTLVPLPRPTDVPHTNRWSSRTISPIVPTTLKSMSLNSKRFDISPFSSAHFTMPNRRPQPTSLPFVQTSAPKPTSVPMRNNVPSVQQMTSRNRNVQQRKQNKNHTVNKVNQKRRKNTRKNAVNPAQLLIAALIQALQNGNLLKQLQLRQRNNQHAPHSSEPQVPPQHSNIRQHHEQAPRNDPSTQNQNSMNVPYHNSVEQNIPSADHQIPQQFERHQQAHENHNINHPQVIQYKPDTQTNPPPKDMPDLSMLQGQEIQFTDVNTGFGGDSPPPVIIQRIPKNSRSRQSNNFNGNSNGVPYEFPTMALHENSAVLVDTSIKTPTVDDDDLSSNSTSEGNETNQSLNNSSYNESVTKDISETIQQDQIIESSVKNITTTPLIITRKIELPDSDAETTEEKQNASDLDKGLNTISDSKNENDDDKNMSHLQLPSMSPVLPEYDFPDLGTPPPLFMTKKDHTTTSNQFNDKLNNLDNIEKLNEKLMLPESHDINDDTTTTATTTTRYPTTTNPTTRVTTTVQATESFVNNVTSTLSPKTTLLPTTSLKTTKIVEDEEIESLSTKSPVITKETTFPQFEDEDLFMKTTSTMSVSSASNVSELKSITMSPITSSTTLNPTTETTTTRTTLPSVAITFPARQKSTVPLVITTESLPKTTSRSSTNSPTTLSIKTTTETIKENHAAYSLINDNMLSGVSDDHISDSETFTTPFPMFHEKMDYRKIFPEMFGLKPVDIIPKTIRKLDMNTGFIPSTSTAVPSSSISYHELNPIISSHTTTPKMYSEFDRTTTSPPPTTPSLQTTTQMSTTEITTSKPSITTAATTTFHTTPFIFLTSIAYRDLFPELFGQKPDRQVYTDEGSALNSFTTRPTTKATTTTTALPIPKSMRTTKTTASTTTSTTTMKTTTKPSTTKATTTIPPTTTTAKSYIEERQNTMPTKDTISFTFPSTIDYRDLFPEMFGRNPLPHIYGIRDPVMKQSTAPTTTKPIIKTTWSPPLQKTYVGTSLEDSRLHREASAITTTRSSHKANVIDSTQMHVLPKEPSNVRAVKKSPEFFVSNNLNGGKLRPLKVRSTTPRTVRVLGRDIVVRTTAQTLSANYVSGNRQAKEHSVKTFTDIVQDSRAGQLSQFNGVQPTQVAPENFNNAISQEPKPQVHFDVVDIPYDPHLDRAATLLSGSKIPNQYKEATPEAAVPIQEPVEKTIPTQSENYIDLSSFSTNSLAANPALPHESNSMNGIADVSTQLDTLLSALGSDIMIHEQKSNDGHVQYKIQGGSKDLPVFVLRTGYRWTDAIG